MHVIERLTSSGRHRRKQILAIFRTSDVTPLEGKRFTIEVIDRNQDAPGVVLPALLTLPQILVATLGAVSQPEMLCGDQINVAIGQILEIATIDRQRVRGGHIDLLRLLGYCRRLLTLWLPYRTDNERLDRADRIPPACRTQLRLNKLDLVVVLTRRVIAREARAKTRFGVQIHLVLVVAAHRAAAHVQLCAATPMCDLVLNAFGIEPGLDVEVVEQFGNVGANRTHTSPRTRVINRPRSKS